MTTENRKLIEQWLDLIEHPTPWEVAGQEYDYRNHPKYKILSVFDEQVQELKFMKDAFDAAYADSEYFQKELKEQVKLLLEMVSHTEEIHHGIHFDKKLSEWVCPPQCAYKSIIERVGASTFVVTTSGGKVGN